MDEKVIHTQAIENMKQEVAKVISAEIESYTTKLLPPIDIVNYIEEQYNAEDNSGDTNGWQWDYWFYYTINDVKYCISGCGFYGGLTFAKA